MTPSIDDFVRLNSSWIASLQTAGKLPQWCAAVHFAFVHRYSSPGHALDGQLCLVAGQERGGQYFGEFNFPGGKIDRADGTHPTVRILRAVYRELWEEMAVCPAVPLHQFVIDIITAGPSAIFVCAVDGISTTKLNAVIALKDKDKRLPPEYKEIHEYRQMTRDDMHKCSSYVRTHFNHIRTAYIATRPPKRLHFAEALRPVYCKPHE